MNPMIPDTLFPDLASESESGASAVLMKFAFAGSLALPADPVLYQMLTAFTRLVDGSFLDYQAARTAYYKFWRDDELAADLAVAAVLLPMFHHIENCLSNLKRVREMLVAIRNRKPTAAMPVLVDKSDWQASEVHQLAIRRLRDAIQHQHNDLRGGKHNDAGVFYDDNGALAFGGYTLSLEDLAATLRAYRVIANKAVLALPRLS
jgi:hypothetical protein